MLEIFKSNKFGVKTKGNWDGMELGKIDKNMIFYDMKAAQIWMNVGIAVSIGSIVVYS